MSYVKLLCSHIHFRQASLKIKQYLFKITDGGRGGVKQGISRDLNKITDYTRGEMTGKMKTVFKPIVAE